MSECFPTFVKGDTLETREGLQEAEFNKALQAGGFQRERDRRVNAPAKNSDPLGAGTYLFSNCEWKDPANEEARNELYQGFQHLAERFPAAARCCSFSRFLEVVAKFHDGWQPYAGRARKKQKSADSLACDDDALLCSSLTKDGKGFKSSTCLGTGSRLTIDPMDKSEKSESVQVRSDLLVNPLHIATLNDMWTFNDGMSGKICQLGSSPLVGANMMPHAADRPSRPLDIEIGLSSSGNMSLGNMGIGSALPGGMLIGAGGSSQHGGANAVPDSAAAGRSTGSSFAGLTSSQQIILRTGAASGVALGKRERENQSSSSAPSPSQSLLLEQMAQLRMRNQTPTPSRTQSPSSGGPAGNPSWSDSPSLNQSNFSGMGQGKQPLARMTEFGGFHGSPGVGSPGVGSWGGLNGGLRGSSGGGLPIGAQAGATRGVARPTTTELLLQNLRAQEYLTKKLLHEQAQQPSGPLQLQMPGLMGPLQGLQGLQQQGIQSQATTLSPSSSYVTSSPQHSSPWLPLTMPGGAHGLSLHPAGGLAGLVSIFNRNPAPAAPGWAALTLGDSAGVLGGGQGGPKGPGGV